MAAISSHRPNMEVDDPHRISHADSDQWDFSVPDPLEAAPQPYKPSSRNDRPFSPSQREPNTMRTDNRARPKDIDLDGVNGTGSLGRSAKKNQHTDPAYLSPHIDQFGQDIRNSRSGSEPDSLLDLYKQPRSAGKGTHEATPESRRSEPQVEEVSRVEDEAPPEAESGWIHREKLLLIEKKEMRELGITPPAPRTHSRSKSRRDRDRSQDLPSHGDEQEVEVPSVKEGKRRRLQSPIQQEEEPEEIPLNHEMDHRMTDEVVTESPLERTISPPYRNQNQTLRSSSSRIPLPKSTPKDGSISGKRGVYPGDNDAVRTRSNSLNSTNLLNDADPSKTPPSNSRPGSSSANYSPTKPRTSSLPRNASLHNRKPSATISGSPSIPSNPAVTTPSNQKPRSTSATSQPNATSTPPSIRPRSRQGLEPRPPTSALNRPEGEPPWLKEMYKPDPRLPPEEQMLPTHAKRLQQEQWDQARKESETRQRDLNQQAGRSEAREHTTPSTSSSSRGRGKASATETENTERERHMQGQRAFSPLALHTRAGLVPSSRDGPLDTTNNPTNAPPPDQHPGPTPPAPQSSSSVANARTYSPLPPTPTSKTQLPQLPHGAQQQGPNPPPPPPSSSSLLGLRNSEAENRAKRVTDPFERERLERVALEEKNGGGAGRVSGGRDGGRMGKEEKEEKGEKTIGCTCCVVM